MSPLVEAGQKGTDEQVIHVPGCDLPPQLRTSMVQKLAEVVAVSPHRMGRGVLLQGEMAEEAADRLLQRLPAGACAPGLGTLSLEGLHEWREAVEGPVGEGHAALHPVADLGG